MIKHEKTIEIDRRKLPEDAIFKGYERVVIQDISLQTDNVAYRKEKYYSPSLRKTYIAELPVGYEGQFGPGIKALVRTLYFGSQMTEPKILEFLEHIGIQISSGQISKLLTKGQEVFRKESDAVLEAGLRSSPYQHTDGTPTRVNGQKQNCQILYNPVYSSYRTMLHKNRLTVLDMLRNGRPRIFRINTEALTCLKGLPLSKKILHTLQNWSAESVLDEAAFIIQLDEKLPKLPSQHRKAIIDAADVAAFHAETGVPVVQTLICDDAPQFNWLTNSMMQCWVHEGQAYKKLLPVVGYHRSLLEDFLKSFWEYYDRMLNYREQPTPEMATKLETAFDELFSTQTGYGELDKRIAKSLAKKDALLLILKYPELPLHNNPAELAECFRVRKRDISFGPRSEDGKHALDSFMTLAATTKKLGVSFYSYIRDCITMPKVIAPLADLIQKAAKQLNLGWSYSLA